MEMDLQIILMGQGVDIEAWPEMVEKYPGLVGLEMSYNEPLAHQIQAGRGRYPAHALPYEPLRSRSVICLEIRDHPHRPGRRGIGIRFRIMILPKTKGRG